MARQIAQELEGPLLLGALQMFNTENRLQRQIEADDSYTSSTSHGRKFTATVTLVF